MSLRVGVVFVLAGLCLGTLASTSPAGASGASLASSMTGSISGVVEAAGRPVEQVCVVASTRPHNGGEACTAADGTYTISGLSPGEYRVEFIPYASDIYLVGQVWPHHQGLSAKGSSVLVRAGHNHRGIDASLIDGGLALVLVQRGEGQPVSDETVCPVRATYNAVDGNCGGTDLSGRGTTGAAPAGPEKVEAIGEGGTFFAPGTRSYRRAAVVDFVADQTVGVAITIP